MSCPVMHEKSTASGGGCPVLHGGGNTAAMMSPQEEFNQKVFKACSEEIQAYNLCQTRDVGKDKVKSHCEPEALALRECELSRRKREKMTKLYEDCIKKGGDSLQCLQQTNKG
jgi:hypothetical protein